MRTRPGATRRPPRWRRRAATPTPERDRPAVEPVRTCVGCRASGSKRTLLRIVRAGASGATLDLRGSMPGRGAYVHPDRACVDRAFAKGANAVFRALRTGSDLDAAARLRHDIEGELQA